MSALRVVAVIPARGGSQEVPRKNVARVGGVPLVARAALTAGRAALVDSVIVSTDDDEIAAVAASAGARIVRRPAELATGEASSESALLHCLDSLEATGELPEVLVFIQATSPFIDPAAIDSAVARVLSGSEDVVFSGIETFAFLWSASPAGSVGINHDAAHRPRRQDREPHYLETGAFYVMRVDGFREAAHRFFGRVGVEIVEESSAIEIDSVEQLAMASEMARLHDPRESIDVDAVVTDFDGVHTDDRAIVGIDGEEHVTVSRSDGMGVRLLREAGVPVLILSTEEHPVVAARGAKLRVDVQHGVSDKAAALRAWADDRDIHLSRIAYIGNDVNDLASLESVGWPIAVPDSHPDVLAASRLVVNHRGGHGAVRELAELVLSHRSQLASSNEGER